MSASAPLPSPDITRAQTLADTFAGEWDDGDDVRYASSPFLSLKQLSSRKKGAAFERVFAHVMGDAGHDVTRAESSDYDRRVNGSRVEVKGSFLWQGGTFRWQQIRLDQDYDYIAFLAFYPDRLEVYGCTHAVAAAHLQRCDDDGNWPHNQHGGKTVNSGTYFVDGVPADFGWMRPISVLFPVPPDDTGEPRCA
jgi:hypothetical protein